MKERLRRLAWGLALPALALMKLASWCSRIASVVRSAALFGHGNIPICHWTVTVKCPENISLGEHVIIGPKVILGATCSIHLGDHVRISEGAMIETAGLDFSGLPPYPHIMRPIRIGRGAWIGARAIILGGVTIGEYAVVGAGTVVTKSVPPRTVYVGPHPHVRPYGANGVYGVSTPPAAAEMVPSPSVLNTQL